MFTFVENNLKMDNFITIQDYLQTNPENSGSIDIYQWKEHLRRYWKLGKSSDLISGQAGMIKFTIDPETMFVKV